METTNVGMVLERPIISNIMACKTNAIINGQRLSNFETSQPDKGMPINWLIGMINSNVPSSASLICNASFKVGIREAQLEKLRPDKKKNVLIAMRCRVFISIFSCKLLRCSFGEINSLNHMPVKLGAQNYEYFYNVKDVLQGFIIVFLREKNIRRI